MIQQENLVTRENDTTYSSNKYSTFSVSNTTAYIETAVITAFGPLGDVLGDTVNQEMIYVQSLGGVRFMYSPLNDLKIKVDSLGIIMPS
jgi:hypothetical protein